MQGAIWCAPRVIGEEPHHARLPNGLQSVWIGNSKKDKIQEYGIVTNYIIKTKAIHFY